MNLPIEITTACQEIGQDRVLGAHDLARRAVSAIATLLEKLDPEMEAEELVEVLRVSCSSLARIRPAIGAIANSVAEVFHRIEQALAVSEQAVPTATNVTTRYLDELDRTLNRTIQHTSEVIGPNKTILTISMNQTVLKALLTTVEADRVIIAESRPAFEGRQTAEQLAKAGVRVEIVSDAAAPGLVREAQVVLLGADSVLADGSVVNKVGSFGISLAAQDAVVPLYAACETLKITPSQSTLTELHPGQELWKNAPAGVKCRNPYFERIPAELLSGIITERGLLQTQEVSRMATVKKNVLKAIGVR